MLIAGIAFVVGLSPHLGDVDVRYCESFGVDSENVFSIRRTHGVWTGTYRQTLKVFSCRPAGLIADVGPGVPPRQLSAPRIGWENWWKQLDALVPAIHPDFDVRANPEISPCDSSSYVMEISDGGQFRRYSQFFTEPNNWKRAQVIGATMDEFKEQVAPGIVEINISPVKKQEGLIRDGKIGSWEKIFFGNAKDPQTIVGRAALSKLADLRTYGLPKGDLEIRVWEGFGITYLEGFVFRRKGDEWSATFLLPADQNHPEYKKMDYKFALRPPRFGWEAWWTKLNMLDILTLPDFESLPGKKGGALDGMSYVVEINQDGHYRTYMYDNPDVQPGGQPELKKIQQIMRFLGDQFGGQLPG